MLKGFFMYKNRYVDKSNFILKIIVLRKKMKDEKTKFKNFISINLSTH